jgi:hypothetical protein
VEVQSYSKCLNSVYTSIVGECSQDRNRVCKGFYRVGIKYTKLLIIIKSNTEQDEMKLAYRNLQNE